MDETPFEKYEHNIPFYRVNLGKFGVVMAEPRYNRCVFELGGPTGHQRSIQNELNNTEIWPGLRINNTDYTSGGIVLDYGTAYDEKEPSWGLTIGDNKARNSYYSLSYRLREDLTPKAHAKLLDEIVPLLIKWIADNPIAMAEGALADLKRDARSAITSRNEAQKKLDDAQALVNARIETYHKQEAALEALRNAQS